uniref:Histone-lysine N-methyltransferase NSD3 n=1 Tax=Lygus hesperus TaxID=30085 RepID=A0A146KU80_LYGHE
MAEDPDPENSSVSDEDSINVRFEYGSIVVAKLGRFPWWPAMVDPCPDTGDIYWLDNFEDLSQKNATHYHVVFFDVPGKVTRSWVHTDRIMHYGVRYPESLTEQEREAVKNMKESRSQRRLVEARNIAEAALQIPVEERRKKYSFMYTYKGKITLFDDEGNKQVIDGSRVGDGSNFDGAETPEPLKSKKKPGPKSKSLTESTKKVAPIRIRKKPGPKPRNKSLPVEYETYTSQTKARRPSTDSSTSTQETDASTSKRTRRTRASYHIVPVSPPSAKPACVPRATHELAQELSVFAASFPVDGDSSPLPSKAETSKRKSRKRKKASKATGKKRGRPSKSSLAPELLPEEVDPHSLPQVEVRLDSTPLVGVCPDSTPLISNTSTRACSPATMDEKSRKKDTQLPEPEIEPVKEQQSKLVLKTPGMDDLSRLQPSENSLGNQMASFLSRIQKQTPILQHNASAGKTISNLNLLVARTEEGGVIDLTEEDDEGCKLRCGEVVFANLKGFQPWPAVVVMDPEINVCFIPKPETPNYVHVFFFHLNRRAWVPIENVTIFEDANYYSEREEMMNYEKYCKALALAQQARLFSREQRSLQYANMRDVPMTGGPLAPIKELEEMDILL